MLSINDVSKTYADGTQALKSITLSLPTGMVGLLGPNGAGKSTLMRTLACLQSSDTGQIVFDNIDVTKEPLRLRKVLGYLPQYFGVYPNMSCETLLKHMASLKGIEKKAAAKQITSLLEMTNLTQVANKNVSGFSGGMRQRFGIAQALLGDPKILIMDEPTAGLDPLERERLHSLLVSISDSKLVLLSTHIVEDIENLCHQVALLFNGEVIDSADVKSLIAQLEGNVWQVDANAILAPKCKILSKSYRFGKPSLRVLSTIMPCGGAIAVEANLQDRYFFELQQRGIC